MLRKLFITKSSHLHIQVFRYGLVAIVVFIIDFGLLFAFTRYLGWYYLVSATLSFSISLVVNYVLSITWVFSKSSYKRSAEITFFIAVGIAGLALNILIIWVCTAWLGLFYLVSKLIAVTIVFFWSFTTRRYFVFHNHKSSD